MYRRKPSIWTALFLVLLALQGNANAQEEPHQPLEDAAGVEEPARPAAPEGAPSETEELPPITVMPALLSAVEAVYPARALEDRVESSVMLEIDLDAQGAVEAARVIEPTTPAGYGFDEAALDAVHRFRFSPAEAAGEAVPVTLTYRHRFVLDAPSLAATGPETNGAAPDEAGPAPETTAAPGIVNLTGSLRERGTRDDLAGVVVTAYRGEGEDAVGYEATSDEQGNFAFRDLEPGTWKLRVGSDGYLPFDTEETVVAGSATEVVYYVERGSTNAFDVLVEGERVHKEVSRRRLSAAEIEASPGTFGDALGVVRNMPGVARAPFGDGRIVVRGASPEDTAITVEGSRIRAFSHFGGIRTIFPVEMLEDVTFIPGNAPVEYGRMTGGVLAVRPKKLHPEGVHGYVDINLFDAGAHLETPIGDKAAIAVGGRRSYIDAILGSMMPEDGGFSFNTAPRYYDLHVLASYRPSAAHELRFYGYAADDAMELLFDNAQDLSAQLAITGVEATLAAQHAGLYYDYTPSTTFSNALRLSTIHGSQRVAVGAERHLFFDWTTVSLRNIAELEVNDRVTLRAGLDGELALLDADIVMGLPPKEGDVAQGYRDESAVQTYDNSSTSPAVGVFVDATLRLTDGLTVTPGVRADVQHFTQDVTVDPRLNARYAFDDHWAIKAGAGLFHQSPDVDEAVGGFGNPDLESERAVQVSAGAEWTPVQHLTVDATVFYNDLDNLVSRTDKTTVRDGEVVPQIFDNGGVGRVVGLEVLARHQFANNLFGWASYTLSRSERKDSGSDSYRLFDFDQTHILSLVAMVRLPWDLELSGRWRYVSGNPTTPIVGSTFVADNDDFAPVTGAVNSDRLQAFHQLDVRLDKRFVFDLWSLDLYVDLQNAYNQPNVESVAYNFDFSDTKPTTGLPIIPAVGLKAEY